MSNVADKSEGSLQVELMVSAVSVNKHFEQ
jgi:hypothetical protein